MSCWGDESIKVSSMAAPIKSGFLLRYKKRFFGKDWREEYVTLYDDSSLTWCRDRNSKEPEGGIYIKDAPEMMAFGNYATKIPNRPLLPEGYTPATLLVFGTKEKDQIHWFLCKYETELQEWATAISNTLPPPPQPQPVQPPPSAPLNSSVQQTGYSPTVPPQPAINPTMQPPTYQAPMMPGQFPAFTNVPIQSGPYLPPNGPLQAPYQQRAPPPSSNTTVVVQDRGRDGLGGGGDFAMGMLVGGAMTSTWGHGIGWGFGGGWGGYHGTAIHDTDVHIHNHYDVDNTVVNNVTNQSTTGNVMSFESQDFDDGDFDDGGDFGGDFGGGDFDGGDF